MAKSAKSLRKKATFTGNDRFPRHSVSRALRIPKAIIDQNAGRECTDRDAASFAGVGFNGPFRVEISSSIKYGLLERPQSGRISPTDRARQAIRPQKPGDEIAALRQCVINSPTISDVYLHYRGENLPDGSFFDNALVDKFGVSEGQIGRFKEVFLESLRAAQLLIVDETDQKTRIVDVSEDADVHVVVAKSQRQKADKKLASSELTCFVVMPFAPPIGEYYEKVYEPAIQKAGLTPVRADADIFGTGKIIDQIWQGINGAKILVAELTSRNPNVFYELGLAHALKKPVVLVSRTEEDVPFDLKHIRVIYYDVADPFWGQKLIDKVAENIGSALRNPEEAIFARALES